MAFELVHEQLGKNIKDERPAAAHEQVSIDVGAGGVDHDRIGRLRAQCVRPGDRVLQTLGAKAAEDLAVHSVTVIGGERCRCPAHACGVRAGPV